MKRLHRYLITEARRKSLTPKGGWHTEYRDSDDNPIQSKHKVKAIKAAGFKWKDKSGKTVGFASDNPGFAMMNDKGQLFADGKNKDTPSVWNTKHIVDYQIPYYSSRFDDPDRWIDPIKD